MPPFSKARLSLAMLILVRWLSVMLPSSRGDESGSESRFEFTQPEMGVPFRIVLYATSAEQAEKAAKAAFDRVAQLNEIMSDYETDSELNKLSRTSGQGNAVPVSADLWRVLEEAQKMARASE